MPLVMGKHSDTHDKYPIWTYIIYLMKKPSRGGGHKPVQCAPCPTIGEMCQLKGYELLALPEKHYVRFPKNSQSRSD